MWPYAVTNNRNTFLLLVSLKWPRINLQCNFWLPGFKEQLVKYGVVHGAHTFLTPFVGCNVVCYEFNHFESYSFFFKIDRQIYSICKRERKRERGKIFQLHSLTKWWQCWEPRPVWFLFVSHVGTGAHILGQPSPRCWHHKQRLNLLHHAIESYLLHISNNLVERLRPINPDFILTS